MTHQNPPDEKLFAILSAAKTIAVVGASSDPGRPSHGIFLMLQGMGYRVVPINPRETSVGGEKAYATLTDVPFPIDIVNVFRQPSATPPIADEAVAVGAQTLWLQLGIANDDAAERAAAGGLNVVMDNCIAVTLRLLRVPRKG